MRNVLKSLLLVLSIQSLFAGSACKSPINGNVAPDSFLQELITWANQAPNQVFESNPKSDVYSFSKAKLAPNGWKNLKHRKAAMLEVMRNLASWESSYSWKAGIDTQNASSAKNKCNEEAGIFQTSANIMAFDKSLKDLFDKRCRQQYSGNSDCIKFIKCSKDPHADHTFTIEITARALRFTTRHWGPLLRRNDVYAHLNPACQKEIEARLL